VATRTVVEYSTGVYHKGDKATAVEATPCLRPFSTRCGPRPHGCTARAHPSYRHASSLGRPRAVR